MRSSYCYVPMCTSTGISTPQKRFFRLCKGDSRRTLWLTSMKRYLTDISPNSMIQVCEDHFNLEEDLENYLRFKLQPTVRPRLKKHVVPHIFACQDGINVAKRPNSHTIEGNKSSFEDSETYSVVEKLGRKRINTELLNEAESELDKNQNESRQNFNDGLNTQFIIIGEPFNQNFEIGEENTDIDFETEENPICDMLIKKEPTEESYYFSDTQTKESKNNQNESIENKSIFNDIGEKDCKIDTLLSYIDAQVRKNLQKLSPEKCSLLISSISDVMNEFIKNA